MEQQTQHRTQTATRLRFALDDRYTDLMVPDSAPLGDVLPAVLVWFGTEAIERGVDQEGWVVHRSGEDALDEECTPVELKLTDGTTLHLRARASALAPIDYDDIVDGVGDQVRNDDGKWTPPTTKSMLLAGFAASMALGLVVVLAGGPPIMRAEAAACIAMAVLVAATFAARAAADAVAGTVLAAVAAVYSGVAGWLAVDAFAWWTSWQWHVVGAGAATVLALGLGLFAVADGALVFATAGVAAALITVLGIVAETTPLTTPQVAAAGLAALVLFSIAVPFVASWYGRLPIPLWPGGATESDIGSADDDGDTDDPDLDPGPDVGSDAPAEGDELVAEASEESDESGGDRMLVDHAQAKAGYATALHIANAVVIVALLFALLTARGMLTAILEALIAVVFLVWARHISGAVQRWVVLVTAAAVLLSAVAQTVPVVSPHSRVLLAWLPLVLLAIVLLLVSELLGDRVPVAPRLLTDILGVLAAAAVLVVLFLVVTGSQGPW